MTKVGKQKRANAVPKQQRSTNAEAAEDMKAQYSAEMNLYELFLRNVGEHRQYFSVDLICARQSFPRNRLTVQTISASLMRATCTTCRADGPGWVA